MAKTKNDAPERIWRREHINMGIDYYLDGDHDPLCQTEYVRADIAKGLRDTCEKMRRLLQAIEAKDPNLSAKQGAIIRGICLETKAALAQGS